VVVPLNDLRYLKHTRTLVGQLLKILLRHSLAKPGYTSVPNNEADPAPVTDAPISEGFRMRLEMNKPKPKSTALAVLETSG
jgi:hypothetical protein